jgi:hypothetical protein
VAAFYVLAAGSAHAQLEWVRHGPGPTTQGQVENITDREVVGAVNDVTPHPSDADILFIGTVNGGIWRTENATATSPHWENLTDEKTSLSIGAIEFDPTDASNQSLVAGFGRFSSSAGRGGERAGLLRTTDGGNNWTSIDGAGTLVGLNISGVAPRGGVIVLSANSADNFADRGIWRRPSATGAWTQISGAVGTGLPAGQSYDLAGDPSDNGVLYTNAGTSGLYRSADTGATWTKVSDAGVDAMLAVNLSNVEFALAPSGAVFVAIVTGGRLAGVFRSDDGLAPWTLLDLPQSTESGVVFGIHPGGQGGTHLSIAADPTDDDIVYVGGDRQVSPDEANPALPPWPISGPNSVGAQNYTGRLYRIDAGQPAGSQATPLTHSGTASNSAPHADSRDMAFAADGLLLEGDDGGVYRRTSPSTATGDWFSVNGDLSNAELYAAAWDAVSNIVVAGAQDTGTPQGILPTDPRWQEVHQGDGGDVAVDDTGTPNQSVRYTSSQGLGGFRRRVFNSANVLQSTTSLTPLPMGMTPQFITPIEVNNATPTRIIVGALDDLYESLDQGSTLVPLGVGVQMNRNPRHPIAYGASDDPNVLYVGSGINVWIRTGAGALTNNAAYSGTRAISDIAIDPDDSQDAFVVDDQTVYMTTNAGGGWTDVTGDLATLDPGDLWAIEFLDHGTDGLGGGLMNDAIAVGGDNGVFVAEGPAFNDWEPLGTGLPNAIVNRLEFDRADRILLASTLGRGAWTLNLTEGPAVDVILVLDLSGSMLSPACAGCPSKLDVLKDSAELFAELWRAMATPDDRIGVNYFRTNIEEYDPGGVTLHPVISGVPNLVADLRAETTTSSQFTAMGGGTQQAINRLPDPAHRRNIIVFTDGMQNVDPLVAHIDDSPPAGAFHLEIADVGEPRTSNVPATVPPTRLDSALDIKVSTIGVGATPAFVDRLSEMADETDGLTHITTAPDQDLRRFFVEDLVNILRDSSPQLLGYVTREIAPQGTDMQDFAVNLGSRQVTVKVSWQRDAKMTQRIYKDGREVTKQARITAGSFYNIFAFDADAVDFHLGGDWQVAFSGGPGRRYELAAISDEPAFDFRFLFQPQRILAGQKVRLELKVTRDDEPFRGDLAARTTIVKPSPKLAKLLFETDWREKLGDKRPDGSPLVEAAFNLLLAEDKDFAELSRGEQVSLELKPGKEGHYFAEFEDTKVAGAYRVILTLEGEDPKLGTLWRTQNLSFVVQPGAVSPSTAGLSVTAVPAAGGRVVIYTVTMKPRDRAENYLGPGRAGDLLIKFGERDIRASPWEDLGDGSYRVKLRAPKGGDPEVTIAVGGAVVFEGLLNWLR